MDSIVQIVPISGYTAVFENVDETEYHPTDAAGNPIEGGKVVTDILAETDANLTILPVLCFALVKSELPRTGGEMYRMVGVFLDPDYGYLELCERMDNETIYAGRLLGYLPPDPQTHPALMNNYRWITASRIDGRYVEETAWQQVLEEKERNKNAL